MKKKSKRIGPTVIIACEYIVCTLLRSFGTTTGHDVKKYTVVLRYEVVEPPPTLYTGRT